MLCAIVESVHLKVPSNQHLIVLEDSDITLMDRETHVGQYCGYEWRNIHLMYIIKIHLNIHDKVDKKAKMYIHPYS